jgi:hypothetical protein
VFGLAYLAYVGIKYPGAPTPMVFLGLAVFLSVRQYWIAVLPGGTLGGGITHVPSIAVLLVFGLYLRSAASQLGTCMLVASVTYVSAVAVRAWDLYLCPSFPLGLHWVWHLLTGLTTSILIYAIAAYPPERVGQRRAEVGR